VNTRQKVEIDGPKFKALLDDVLKRIRDEDPHELDAYRALFRKNVPFFLRSYVAAYLLRQASGRLGPRQRPSQVTTLFVSIGKNRKVFPRDLVLFFVHGAQLSKSNLGDIKILENYSFVEVEEPLAAKVIQQLDGSTFRGRRVSVNFAKKRNSETSEDSEFHEESFAQVDE
jgi:ATP-dependent RNA helicase DeaD